VPFHAYGALGEAVQTLARDKESHQAHDADYQWLLSALASLEQSRKDRSLSLNLKQREHERDTLDESALARENARRVADALPPIKALTELKADEQPDVVLAEAARITARYALGSSAAGPTTAAAHPRPAVPPARP
jgi:hypothetical protein